MTKNSDDIYQHYKNWDMKKGIRGFENPLMQKFLQAKNSYEKIISTDYNKAIPKMNNRSVG